jgi:hypothetical protein
MKIEWDESYKTICKTSDPKLAWINDSVWQEVSNWVINSGNSSDLVGD